MNNDFLNKVEPQHMNQMVDCMFENVYTEGQLVIREGEPGNYLYVLSGNLQLRVPLWFLILNVLENLVMGLKTSRGVGWNEKD